MANVKSAPLALTPAVVEKLTGARPAYGKGIVRVAIKGRLVDQAKGGRNA